MSISARRMLRAQVEKPPLDSYTFSFDSGVQNTAVSTSVTAPGDHAWDAVGFDGGSTYTNNSTHVAHGTMASRLVPTAGASTVVRWTTPSSTRGAFRWYTWWDSLPTDDTIPLWLGSSSTSKVANSVFTPTGIVRGYTTGRTGSLYSSPTNTLPLGQWSRIEMAYEINTTNPSQGRIRFAIYNGESTTPVADSGWIVENLGSDPVTYLRFGKYDNTGNTTPHWNDSIAYRNDISSPIGPFVPADGSNTTPTANAGPDQVAPASSTVTLNGSGSNDPDGTITNYNWTQTSGPSVTLTNPTSVAPSFTAPSSASTLTFALRVTDNNGAISSADSITITVTAASFVRQATLAGAATIGQANYPVPSSNTVWVSPAGSDGSGAGTKTSPYRTLNKAANVAPSGSTIIMRGGEYHEGGVYWRAEDSTPGGNSTLGGVFFTNDNVTVQNYPGETVWFDGSEVVGGWTFDGTNWRKPFVTKYDRTETHTRGQDEATWPGGGGQAEGFVVPEYPCAAYAEQLLLDGTQLTQVRNTSELGPGKFCVEGAMYGGSSVNINVFITSHYVMRDNPTNRQVRISTISRLATVVKSNITFRGVGIRRYSPALVDFGGLYVGSNSGYFTMENCVIEDIQNLGMIQASQNATIRYNTVQRVGQTGIGVGRGSDNSLYEYNLFIENNYSHYNYGPDAGAVKASKVWNITFRYNTFRETYGHALWFDESCYLNDFYSNDFSNNDGRGILYEISAKGYIVDNLFVNNGINADIRPPYDNAPIWLSGSNNCEIWNNTTINSVQHFKIAQDIRNPNEPGNNYGRDNTRPAAFYDGSDPNYAHNGQMTWFVDKMVYKNNLAYKIPSSGSIQAAMYTIFDARRNRDSASFGVQTGGNLYNRLSSSDVPRFANGTLPNGGVQIFSNMTSNAYNHPSGTSAPSWKAMTDETGSQFIDNSSALVTGNYPYEIKPSVLSTITAQPMPAAIAARSGRSAGDTHVGAWLPS